MSAPNAARNSMLLRPPEAARPKPARRASRSSLVARRRQRRSHTAE